MEPMYLPGSTWWMEIGTEGGRRTIYAAPLPSDTPHWQSPQIFINPGPRGGAGWRECCVTGHVYHGQGWRGSRRVWAPGCRITGWSKDYWNWKALLFGGVAIQVRWKLSDSPLLPCISLSLPRSLNKNTTSIHT